MAHSAEPKKETVRIALPPQPTATPAEVPPAKRDTVRINLPRRPPVSPTMNPAQIAPEVSAPRPPATTGSTAAAVPLPVIPPPDDRGPEKETARITVLPGPPARPGVQMKKTQPLIDMPVASAPETPVTVAPQPRVTIDEIPKRLCWALLGVSAAILIIQIWSYFS